MPRSFRTTAVGLLGLLVGLGAAVVPVTSAHAAGTGRITGTVTGPGGAGLGGVGVTTYEWLAEDGWWAMGASALTDATGRYELDGLETGEYVLAFEDHATQDPGQRWATEYWADAAMLTGGAPVAVTADAPVVTGVDATLAEGGDIAGTVVGTHPVDDVWAEAYQKLNGVWEYVNSAPVTAGGAYRIRDLPAGTYRLGFEDEGGPLATEYWNDQPTLELAENITVTPGGLVTGRNAALAAETLPTYTNEVAPTISGTAQVGQTLTASPGTWTPSGAAYTYRWLANGVSLAGGTGRTLVLTAGHEGRTISVEVTATGSSGRSGTQASSSTAPVAAAPTTPDPTPTTPTTSDPTTSDPTPTTAGPLAPAVLAPAPLAPVALAPAPTPTAPAPVDPTPAEALTEIVGGLQVGGKLAVGRTLTLKNLLGSFRGTVTYRIQWYAGRSAIQRAIKPKLRLASNLRGKVVSVKVKATSGGVTKTRKIKVGRVRG